MIQCIFVSSNHRWMQMLPSVPLPGEQIVAHVDGEVRTFFVKKRSWRLFSQPACEIVVRHKK